ncbi:MAG: hypothetical protein LJE66_04660 [Desulfobacterales bacterium]|jgi:hypothetical protein|nr:hypothetical protein [Desulfobacterales bacterium]
MAKVVLAAKLKKWTTSIQKPNIPSFRYDAHCQRSNLGRQAKVVEKK